MSKDAALSEPRPWLVFPAIGLMLTPSDRPDPNARYRIEEFFCLDDT